MLSVLYKHFIGGYIICFCKKRHGVSLTVIWDSKLNRCFFKIPKQLLILMALLPKQHPFFIVCNLIEYIIHLVQLLNRFKSVEPSRCLALYGSRRRSLLIVKKVEPSIKLPAAMLYISY